MPEISLFKNATDTNSNQSLNIDDFIGRINEGYWQDAVLKVRTLKNKDEQDNAKKRLPMVTVSGLFTGGTRTDKTLSKHSGFIQIDLDKLEDVEDAKSFLYTDEYLYAGFVSCRGYGLCLIFKINPKKHRDAFAAISQYLYEKYKVIVDPTSVNESRGRFVSYDPHAHYNPNAKKFEQYLEKKKEPKKVPNIIFTQTDFDLILQQVQNKKIDLTATYDAWLRTAFALTDKFGEHGREYFHVFSEQNPEYNRSLTDKQYDACLKSKRSGVSIATLYYYAKQAGISTVSEQTRQIAQSASIAQKSGKDRETAEQSIKEYLGDPKQTQEILSQVFDQGVQIKDDDSIISKLQLYFQQTYTLRFNVITRRIEVNGNTLDDILFNDIWCDSVKVFEKVTSEAVKRVLHSSFVKKYNPFIDFFDKYKLRKPKGVIENFISCIETDAGLAENEFYPEYSKYFFTKWIVGLISAMHHIHSPLMLVLTGGQNTGKTEVFRRLLPTEIIHYYAEISSGMKDTDFHIMMTQKLIIMDDEMESRSRAETNQIKSLTSKQTFTVRAPYGQYNEDLLRLGVLCGTTNENEILRDKTGNRRIIPLPVISIDYNKMNNIDRIDLLMESYWLWKSGFDWNMSKDDIKILENNTGRFVEISAEQELVIQYFRKPSESEISFHMMPTEIKSYIEKNSQQRIFKKTIIQVMKNLGYEYKQKKVNGHPVWGFSVMRILQNQ